MFLGKEEGKRKKRKKEKRKTKGKGGGTGQFRAMEINLHSICTADITGENAGVTGVMIFAIITRVEFARPGRRYFRREISRDRVR